MGETKKRKWTVFFLIKSVDDSIDELITMVNEIRSLDFNDEICIVFCIHMVDENLAALLSGDPTRITKNKTPTYTTLFYVLERDHENINFPNKLHQIAEKADFDITNPDHLKVFFKTDVLNKYRAKRYILFTWDHGRPFGIFAKTNDETKGLFSLLPEIGSLILRQQTDNRILSMDELANAIKWGFGKKRIDLLIMMNCVTQIVDSGFALKDVVKYIVASEIAMDYNGYNYPLIFQLLIGNPKISSRKLARRIVSSFSKKVYPTVEFGIYQKSLSAISANDLHSYNLLVKLIDKLSDYLTSELPTTKTNILNARNNSIVNATYQLVDFYTFIKNIEDNGIFQKNPLLASLLLSIQELIIIKYFMGSAFSETNGISKYRPTGLSLYFPNAILPEDVNQPELQQTSFYKTSKWKEFLIKCLAE